MNLYSYIFVFFNALLFNAYAQTPCTPRIYSGSVVSKTAFGNGIKGVQIIINNVDSQISNDAGNFRYELNQCPGSLVRVQAIKYGYSIVNHIPLSEHVLTTDLPANKPQFLVILCPDEEIKDYRIEYYSKLVDENFSRYINNLKAERNRLRNGINKSSRENVLLRKKLEQTEKSLHAALNRTNVDNTNRRIAETFSNLDTEDIDSTYQKAFHLYQIGNFSGAQLILSAKELEEDSKSLRILEKKVVRKREKLINKYILKAVIADNQANYDTAYKYFNIAFEEDTTKLINGLQFAEFLAAYHDYKNSEKILNMILNKTKDELSFLNIRALNLSSYIYIENHQYDKAKISLTKTIDFCYTMVLVRPSIEMAKYMSMALSNASYLYKKLDPRESINLRKLSLDMLYELHAHTDYKPNSEIYASLTSLAISMIESKEHSAKDTLQKALLYFDKDHKTELVYKDEQLIYILNGFALYYILVEFDEAKQLDYYKKAYDIADRIYKINPIRFTPIRALCSLNLGSVYFHIKNKNLDLAETYLVESVKLYEKLSKDNAERFRPDLIMALQKTEVLYEYKRDRKSFLIYHNKLLQNNGQSIWFDYFKNPEKFKFGR